MLKTWLTALRDDEIGRETLDTLATASEETARSTEAGKDDWIAVLKHMGRPLVEMETPARYNKPDQCFVEKYEVQSSGLHSSSKRSQQR